MQYVLQDGMVFVDCAQRNLMKPIGFMFSQYWFEIAVEHYVWDALGDESVCLMLVAQNSYNFFLFGQPIFQAYYTVHDLSKSTITFAPLDGMTSKVPVFADIPSEILLAAEPPTFWEQYG